MSKMPPKPKGFDFIHTGDDIASYTTEQLLMIQSAKNSIMPLPLPLIGEYFAPLLPGQTCLLQGQTSHGKTMLMDYWQDALTPNIPDGRMLVRIDYENPAEDIGMLALGRNPDAPTQQEIAQGKVINWDAVLEMSRKLGTENVLYVSSTSKSPNLELMSVPDIVKSLDWARKYLFNNEFSIAGIFADYLQAFPPDYEKIPRGASNTDKAAIDMNFEILFRAAQMLRCGIVIGGQSKQDQYLSTKGNALKIPAVYDSFGSSFPPYRTRRSIQVWMPKMHYHPGQTYEGPFGLIESNERQQWVKVGKQRGNLPSGESWLLEWNYDTMLPTVMKFEDLPGPDLTQEEIPF